jgi:hypothetical protein
MAWRRKIPLDISDPTTWYTRAEAAKLLKCCISTVIAMEGRRLHPFVDEKGTHRYNPVEVRGIEVRDHRKLQRHVPTRGDLEAAATSLIRQGKSKLDIVEQLGMPYDDVQAIWEKSQVSFEDAAEAKRKLEVRKRHEARQLHAAELASRERIEKLRIEKERTRADAQAQKDIARMLRKSLGQLARERKVEDESPDEDETGGGVAGTESAAE